MNYIRRFAIIIQNKNEVYRTTSYNSHKICYNEFEIVKISLKGEALPTRENLKTLILRLRKYVILR